MTKRILAVMLLLAVSCSAQIVGRHRKVFAAAGVSRSASIWETLDFSSLSTTNLSNNDGGTACTWSITGAANLSMNAAAERALSGTTNGGSDASGTYGMRYNTGANNSAGYIECNFTAANTVVIGFWWQFPANFVGSYTEHDIATMYTTLGNKNVYIKAADSNQVKLHIFNPTDGYSTGVNVSPATWYFLTVEYLNNNASGMKLRIYDTTGSLVGTEQTRSTASDSGVYNVTLGSFIGGNPFTGYMYYDDLLISFSSSDYPYLP